MGVYFLRIARLTSLKRKVEAVGRELDKLKPVVQRVSEIQSKKQELDRKFKVMNDLMKARFLYPIFMEDFALILPSRVWITSLNTTTGDNNLTLSFNVLARDNYAVADFINALEVSEQFSDIKFAGITTISFEEGEVRSLSVQCNYKPARTN